MYLSNKKYNYLITKINQIMVTDQQVLAIVTELQGSQTTLATDLSTIVADIAAATEAGTPVSASTLASLQGVADSFKANVATLDAAINPPAEAAQAASTTEATASTDASAGTADAGTDGAAAASAGEGAASTDAAASI
jgi:hypothetical protein